jgi:GT2 family glycosyltransferase
MAEGDFIAILDHDDVLAPNMLFEVASALNADRMVDVVYYDEDKLSEDGTHRHSPFFKPDWAPEMLLAANYLTHAVYRRALVQEVGGFDLAFEGAQDWDLAFKVTERTNRVVHIPKVLYHWRQVVGSTAGAFNAKAYVFENQLRCVQDHLHRSGLKQVETRFEAPGYLRALWPPASKKVSIIIPTRDKVDYLKRTIDSLLRHTDYPAFEIILVDNDSSQPETLKYYEKLRLDSRVTILDYREKFNFSRANNIGARHAAGEILLFLNNDMEILHADWLEEMVRWAERPEIGVVGAKLLYPDNTIQHAGVIVGMEGHASHVFYGAREKEGGVFGSVDWYRNFTAITGACMMLRREVFESIGGFDEKYILAFSDIELCIRAIDHGYRVMYTPYARLHHYEGRSRGDHIPSNDIRVGIEDFKPLVERGDPYFNPNLSYLERMPTVAPLDEEDRLFRLLRVAAVAKIDLPDKDA